MSESISQRKVYLIPGVIFFMLASAGAVIPLLPTVPFLLLSLWFLARSSPSVYVRVKKSRIYQKYGERFNPGEGISLSDKFKIVIPVLLTLAFVYYRSDNTAARIMILAAALIKIIVFMRIKTRKPGE